MSSLDNPSGSNPGQAAFPDFAQEFNGLVGRTDGEQITHLLATGCDRRYRDWFYRRVWLHFRDIPQSQWSQSESHTAERVASSVAAVYQSLRGAEIAVRNRFISESRKEPFRFWMHRLIGGDADAIAARANWLPDLLRVPNQLQQQMLSAQMAKYLPRIHGQSHLLLVYMLGLDARVEATVLEAFGDSLGAEARHSYAELMEAMIAKTYRDYLLGGGEFYAIEGPQGFCYKIDGSLALFPLWTQKEYALQAKRQAFDDADSVVAVSYREMADVLRQMIEDGDVSAVLFDPSSAGDYHAMTLVKAYWHVSGLIHKSESTGPVKEMKAACEAADTAPLGGRE